jgi:RNA polymerase sigma-70 factor (ECF subfamily)
MNDVVDVNPSRSSRSSSGVTRSLIDRLRTDDADAWDRLVELYAPLVAHWCRRWRMTEADVADVLQEVFQAVASHLSSLRLDRQADTFRGWLQTITANKIHDFFRKQEREPRATGGSEALERMTQFPDLAQAESSADATGSVAPTSDDASQERQLFRRGLELIRGEFEPRTWQAFWQTAVDDRAVKDVAADLGMTPGAVRVAKSRVLHRLRAELGDMLE